MGWHGLFPGYVIAYALLARHERSRQAPPRFDLTLAPRWLLATAALAALTLVLAAQGEAWLPRLMFGNLYASPVTQAVLLLGWVAHLAAFMVLFRATRLRRLIDLWIGVMLIAMMIDLALSAVLISGRYQLGWYVGRAYGLLAAVFVLSVLLRETIALNRQAVEVAEWLRASEAQRRIVSDLVPDLLWTTDAQGRLAWHNERFLCYAGPVGLGNFDWRRLVCPDDLPRVIAAWQASLDSGAPFESEHRLQRVDGQWRWHLVRAEAWRTGDGEIRLWIGSATDVHEQRSALALLEQRVQERTAALEREAERRRTLLARVERLQDDERRRIARDLHDVLGQEIVALSLALDDAASALQQRPGSTGAALQRARERLAAVDRELDGIVFQLRPTALEDMGLADAIAAHAAQWGRHAGVAVDIASHGPVQERLPPHVEAAVFRAVQEALTNVARHAQARGVALLVERTRGRLQVAVEDDGVGFMPDATGAMRGQWGLLGMQERLAALGGEVQLESQPGRGTTVLMRVPL
jgi:PAS domain S-box-containing protein